MLPPHLPAIGSDRFLCEEELADAVPAHPALASAWQLYQDAFDGYCETRLDAQWHRLTHPARWTGRVTVEPAASVVVFGTGPSAHQALPALAAVRDHVVVITSPRGAELLARHQLAADLVLVEHQTALDAHHSARSVADGVGRLAATSAWVAADWRTPAALLAGVPSDRLFVPEPLPTWGLWPATAVMLALDGGASRVALLGVDLGSPDRLDPTYAALARLLTLIARASGVMTADCGAHGATKRGWDRTALEAFVSGSARAGALDVRRRPAPTIAARRSEARHALDRLSRVVVRSHAALRLALAARDGHAHVGELETVASELMAWRDDRSTRVLVQGSLGVSFLPRLWRLGLDDRLGPHLWRPLALAAHELVAQADRLDAHCREQAA